jgi:hypothetical protein
LIFLLVVSLIVPANFAFAQSRAVGEEQFPQSIIAASSTDTTPHLLKLRAIQQGDAEPKKISGYKIDLTNVITAQINSQVLVFTTDSSLQVLEAKVRTVSGRSIDLVPSITTQTNAFSIAGLPVGVYTLDIITQKGNTKAAYEAILVISQQPTTVINETTRDIINQEINQNTRVDTDVKVVFRERDRDNDDDDRDDGDRDPECGSNEVYSHTEEDGDVVCTDLLDDSKEGDGIQGGDDGKDNGLGFYFNEDGDRIVVDPWRGERFDDDVAGPKVETGEPIGPGEESEESEDESSSEESESEEESSSEDEEESGEEGSSDQEESDTESESSETVN